ncbi:unnamed protein product [Kuraishia capsulata CBS 1993]|uniref:RRM domain-containing protein n=1 Tax=Kuraishia capsulata CBS 1993 TaxID=1382522 RepID=W6MUS9_9ASCO|nr:uncharacterized protein KUCA_T00001861001 [Kuraishia capsulata CBS 1993]CDK25890.1 unnamed protein product [Kuraishia capsulata CBS 1993]
MSFPPYQYQDYRNHAQQINSHTNMIPMMQPQYLSSPQNRYQYFQHPQQPPQQQYHHVMPQYHHPHPHQLQQHAHAQYGGYPMDDDSIGQQQQQPVQQQQQSIGSGPSRTVYLGNIPEDLSPRQLLDHVRSGTVENVRIFSEKNCAFVSFLDDHSAMLFHSDAILKRLTIGDNDIRIGWGKPSPVAPVVMEAVSRYNATRNVYLGNLPAEFFDSEEAKEELLKDLEEFGTVESCKFLREKRIAFLHFTSILSAIRTVQNLPLKDNFRDRKVSYGKDRCAFITKTQQHNAAQYLGLNPNFDNRQILSHVDREFISNALVQQSNAAAAIATSAGGANNLGNRTVYLGNLHPETTLEEICNVVRGGILQNIRLIRERHVCFITFIDPIAAAQFFAMSSLNGLIIHGRKIKIGWGKHSGGLSNALSLAVGNGASRNIYIGGLDDDDVVIEEDEGADDENNETTDETTDDTKSTTKTKESSAGSPEATDPSTPTTDDTDPEHTTSSKITFSNKKLHEDFKQFGEIEQINFYREKHCAFVNFTNISNAIKAMDGIKEHKDYLKLKINFGKDRCGNLPRQFNKNHENPAMKDDDYYGGSQHSFGLSANTDEDSGSQGMGYSQNGFRNAIGNIDEDENET